MKMIYYTPWTRARITWIKLTDISPLPRIISEPHLEGSDIFQDLLSLMPCRVQERESTLRLIREEGTHGWHNPCVYIYICVYVYREAFICIASDRRVERRKKRKKRKIFHDAKIGFLSKFETQHYFIYCYCYYYYADYLSRRHFRFTEEGKCTGGRKMEVGGGHA